jgi:predicted amino acid-binding ACT domain protein
MVISSNTIASQVRQILERDITYATLLNNKLVSASKLSKQIMDELAQELGVDKKALKQDTVVKAVKRYLKDIQENDIRGKVDLKAIQNYLAQSHLVVRSDLAVLCSKISAHFPDKFAKIVKYLYTKEDHILHAAQASTAVTLVFDECELDKVEEIINPEYTLYSRKGCAAIKVISPMGVVDQPGIFSYILNLLATSGINLITITFSYTELIFILDKKDEVKAFHILKNEIDRLRENNLHH